MKFDKICNKVAYRALKIGDKIEVMAGTGASDCETGQIHSVYKKSEDMLGQPFLNRGWYPTRFRKVE